MNKTTKNAVYVVLTSVGVAFLFNYLFFDKWLGISAFIFIMVLVGVVVAFSQSRIATIKSSWWLLGLIGFFALMPGIRANDFLNFLNVCAVLGLLVLLAQNISYVRISLLRLWDYIMLAIFAPLRMLGSALSTITLASKIQTSSKEYNMWLRVLKGVIMATPILLIFGLLFAQADLAFSSFIKNFADISISPHVLHYSFVLVFVFVAALGFLSYIFFPWQEKMSTTKPTEPEAAQSKSVEIVVFLGLISALFFVFIGFQITYLFGGEQNITQFGFTYAEYAHRGFWELLLVAMLTLGILFATEKYAGLKKGWRFLAPALVLIGEVMVVIASAYKRLTLYIGAYSMTTLRFYVTGFILLLCVLFILLAVKFILAKREQFFVFGTLLSVLAFLVVVNLLNPDAFIARYNVREFERSSKVDAAYIGGLSMDAEKEKVQLYQKMRSQNQNIEALQEHLMEDRDKTRSSYNTWQSTNYSRTRASRLLQNVQW